ncbi:MAG: hypothetical protein QXT45_04895 [Candidatus Bilamarchaeaceae archaeon]
MPDLDFAVKYPFSSDAKEAVSGIEVTDEIVEKAVGLILSAMVDNVRTKQYLSDEEKKEDVAAYAVARMILGAMRNRYVTGKFAVAIAKLTRRNLNQESEEKLKRISAMFGIRSRNDEVFIVDYLRFSPKEPHYALLTRKLNKGWVKITDSEKKRLIEEAVRKHVEHIPLVKNPSKAVKDAILRIEKELPRREQKIVPKLEEHPPCVSHLLDEIKKHHNLPHHARWFLAVYLIEQGLSNDEIVALYSNLPDFEEKKTRYQIEHARKRGYAVPSCATIASYGICVANCGISSPTKWRGKRNE